MELSSNAKKDLQETFKLEINLENLSDEELNKIGLFLLEIYGQGLKRRSRLTI